VIKTSIFIFIISLSVLSTQGQNEHKTPANGVADQIHLTTVFVNATIQASPENLMHNASMMVRGSKIVAIGSNIPVPEGAHVVDLNGKWIFPSFIELNSHYGVSKAPNKKASPRPLMESKDAFKAHWNEAIHPEYNSATDFHIDKAAATKLRASGFGVVLSHQKNGIARGTSVLVELGTDRPIAVNQAATHFSFSKGNSKQDYPSSMMGSMALIRQMFSSFDWYRFHKQDVDLSMDALSSTHRLPMFFESRDYQESIRAQKLAKESGRSFIIVGAGDSRKDIPGLKTYNTRVVVPIKGKKALALDKVIDLNDIPLQELQDWKYAAYNAYQMSLNGIPIAISYEGHNSSKEFFTSLRKTIQHGLPRSAAIAALTSTPAEWLSQNSKLGALKPGLNANFFISDKDVFTDKAIIYQNWIDGKNYQIHNLNIPHLEGIYQFIVSSDTSILEISGNFKNPKAKMGSSKKELKSVTIKWDENGIEIRQKDNVYYGNIEGRTLSGYCTKFGKTHSWKATFSDPKPSPFESIEPKELQSLPVKAFAYASGKRDFLVKNCTVWTCDENGVVPNLDVLVRNGKIVQIGENILASEIAVIDGSNMHLTPGMIDEHSHIAIKRGVNESGQSITSEVRIQDVVNADDINLYRQVAGGTTSSHLLHGSANPIGGQTALIKLKYGKPVRDVLFPNDHRFIKFALGENVKQSNWGGNKTVRFPQTRMGVEQVFIDGFTRAKKYGQMRANDKVAIDWELEALLEILESKRFITCHSYQQGEINMLMHVADSFGFRVNTFTHILEGYKVADKLKKHGAAASTFSDWWAYKFEVNDAIPFNAALLNEMGVLTGINSDDVEMGRRLNQEAAKTVKYGGVSEEDALNMVTINPAKMLHIDDRVGSITEGKDADLVLWTGNPLSNYSRVHTTWIEGEVYFNIELDKKERERIQTEKIALIAEMRKDKSPKKDFKPKEPKHYHCDSIEHE
jgi:imidazolonepropionase-like amidohydrolase